MKRCYIRIYLASKVILFSHFHSNLHIFYFNQALNSTIKANYLKSSLRNSIQLNSEYLPKYI